MKTLVYGAGPIGRWLALRLQRAGREVTLLARGETFDSLMAEGVVLVDGFTGERRVAQVDLVETLEPEDSYDLVVVAMRKSSRLSVCPILAANAHLGNILFVGNDVSGFQRYTDFVAREKVLLGFPGVGGGRQGDDLVFIDGDKTGQHKGEIFLGELDGGVRPRTRAIADLLRGVGIEVSLESDMDGWLKYHFAFMAPTAGVVLMKGGDLRAVAADDAALRQYIRACREAGDVLRSSGYPKRQPPIFNLYYWLPEWMAVRVFRRFFSSRRVEVQMGLHASEVREEIREMEEEFRALKAGAALPTPNLDRLLGYAR